MVLEEVYRESQGSERFFKHKAILFIPSESYEAAVITVIEGLHKLGFTIYTINKSNINSWFCNKVIDNPNKVKFDFVLSGLHWGTRWSYYDKYKLHRYLKILIDSCDNPGLKDWKEKYALYSSSYINNPAEDIKELEIMPYPWTEPLSGYEPDIVFTSQKNFGDKESIYLPFGIRDQYKTFFEGRKAEDRDVDFTHILGGGSARRRTYCLIKVCTLLKIMPGRVFNGIMIGDNIVPEQIKHYVAQDKGVHGYWRWVKSRCYFRLLNRTKVFIYPGVQLSPTPWWDSERPWEAYASGCLVVLKKPNVDVSQYPVTEISPFAVYNSDLELLEKCWFLYRNQSFLERTRLLAFERAIKYFSSVSIANYFLAQIRRRIHT
jgi:hypothetical protein